MYAIVNEDDQLRWSQVDDLVPRRGEVQIDVYATAVNRADLVQRAGNYQPPRGTTDILGLECAGTIADIGEGVHNVSVGDAVCAILSGGGYAETVTVAAGQVLPIPQGLDFVQAAGIPEVFATAYLNLFLEARLSRGETVLIHAGASGVGTAAVQLCKEFDSPCFVTVGSAAKVAMCKSLGATEGWVRSEADFAEKLLHSTNERGVDVILDPVGASYLSSNLRVLSKDGRLVIIGTMGGAIAELPIRSLMAKRQRIIGSTLRARSIAQKAQLMDLLYDRVWPLLESGAIRVMIHRVYPIQEAETAHEEIRSNTTIGKVILQVR